ncbi:hypothetical protein [Massilia oculi]|uniref:hypothetical protein n=1 Tax=Massilia oculi TaxID=945844 RepID=UPI001E64235F|nr:hypothetical protein [Massilia oculi]
MAAVQHPAQHHFVVDLSEGAGLEPGAGFQRGAVQRAQHGAAQPCVGAIARIDAAERAQPARAVGQLQGATGPVQLHRSGPVERRPTVIGVQGHPDAFVRRALGPQIEAAAGAQARKQGRACARQRTHARQRRADGERTGG